MNLYLIGYRGCGKSTVAPLVASQFGWQFVDSDDRIESDSNQTIAEIFAEHGESEFRVRESKLITDLAAQWDLVVSLGGGAPTQEINRQLIAHSGKTVWLNASADVLWDRISSDPLSAQQRPDLTRDGGRDEVTRLLAERTPVYNACADYKLNVDRLTPQETADRIVNWWRSVDNMNTGPPV